MIHHNFIRYGILAFSLAFAKMAYADDKKPRLYEMRLISHSSKNWKKVLPPAVTEASTVEAKAKALFQWITENITYDLTEKPAYTADQCFKKKSGVCQAYCELYYQMGTAAGLDVRIVNGSTKNSKGEVTLNNHSWIVVNRRATAADDPMRMPLNIIYEEGHEDTLNFVRTRGIAPEDAIVMDVAWGAGAVVNGEFKPVESADFTWFDVDPRWMIFTHYPDIEGDQLLHSSRFTLDDFKRMPSFKPYCASYGLPVDSILEKCGYMKAKDFLDVYPGSFNEVELLSLPLEHKLKVGQPYTFSFRTKKKGTRVLLLSDNDTWRPRPEDEKDGVVTMTVVPKEAGILQLCVGKENGDGSIATAIGYDVVAQ